MRVTRNDAPIFGEVSTIPTSGAGESPRLSNKIRVGVVGIGNCAAMLIQGVDYYKNKSKRQINGLIRSEIGKYAINDIEFVAAFDVSKDKVGKSLDKAIFAQPNIVKPITLIKKSKVTVSLGPVLDGVADHMLKDFNPINSGRIEDVINTLKRKKVEILINLLPVGSEHATRAYANAALSANCAFINAIPVFIASGPEGKYRERFDSANLPLIGDDMKGQLGATILHRTLVALCRDRGIKIENTYQLNVGGNTDFLNMKDEERLSSKRLSKTEAVTSIVKDSDKIDGNSIRIGPSDYVGFLGNQKVAYINIKGKGFANLPVDIEVKLSIDDKMNSSAVLIDSIRATKLALDRKEPNASNIISAVYFKHPMTQAKDDVEARRAFEAWLNK